MTTFTLTLTFQAGDPIRLLAASPLTGESSGTFVPPFGGDTLRAVTRALESDLNPDNPRDAPVVELLAAEGFPLGLALREAVGECLGDALCASPEIARALNQALGVARAEHVPLELNLRFEEGCGETAALPWELLRHEGRFLVADNAVTLARTPLGTVPYGEALGALPLRILLVLSEPLGVSPIAPQRQARELAHGLRALASEGAVVVDELRPPTYPTLVEAVRGGGYHVLHFYGHGVYEDGAGYLLFEDSYGGSNPVRADAFGAVLRNSSVRLVVMGACQSAMGGGDPWSSAAAEILRAEIPLVVGMQVSMRVDAAQAFTRQFYLSLAAGRDVASSVGDARLPLLQREYDKSWFIPALYSRVRGHTRLFDPAAPRPGDSGIVELFVLHEEVERLQEQVGRLGVAECAAEVGQLRAAQGRLREVEAAWNKTVPGGYRPVIASLYGVPPQNPHFVGRVEELRRVARRLEGAAPVVVWGLGGIGKTALAVEAVRRQSWRYGGGVLWLDCRGGLALDSMLNQIGAFCGHPEVEGLEPAQRRAMVRGLLSRMERCLLVWDNAEDVWGEREVRRFVDSLPPNCGALLTTREDPQQAGWPTVELDPLAGEEMTDLFLVLAGAAGVKAVAEDLPLIRKILAWLEGHPLALTLVVPLAKTRGLARLWQDLQRQPLKGVEAALRVSYERLGKVSQRALTALSVFTVPFVYPVAEVLLLDQAGVDDAVDELIKRALLAFDGRHYSYHALVRQFAYRELREVDEAWQEVHQRAAAYLAAKGKDQGLTPAESLEMVDQWERAEEWETFAQSASGLVGVLDRHGYWAEIEERLGRALEAARAHLGESKLEGQLLSGIGWLAYRQGEWDRAIDVYERSLEAKERLGDVPGAARTLGDLGGVYAAKGEWDRAIELYQRILETLERLGDVPGAAQTLNNLGLVYTDKGEWDRAIDVYERSLEAKERLGDVHGAAQTLGNLGNVYAAKGEWDRAIELYERDLEISERLGDVHGAAQTLGNLGSVYRNKGEWDRAIELHQRSLEAKERLGDVSGVARTLNNLGLVYADKGEWDRAIGAYGRSLEAFERLGDVPGAAQTLGNLGNVYARKGEWDRAIEAYERSLETKERLGDVPGAAQTLGNLGNVYRSKGEWDRAIEAYERILETFERLGDVPGAAQTLGNLGLVYADKGEWDRAIELYERDLEISERLGDVHGAAYTRGNLGNIYQQRGELAKAEEMFQQTLDVSRRLGDIHSVGLALYALGGVYQQRGNRDRAAQFFAQAYLIFSQMGSPSANSADQGLVQACGSPDAASAYLARLAEGGEGGREG